MNAAPVTPAEWREWSARTGRPIMPSLTLARSAGRITDEQYDAVVDSLTQGEDA
jgi:hypothetical protein